MSHDKGGSFAIAGFVFQFLNTIDRGLSASLVPGGANGPILILEPPYADVAEITGHARVIQYKTRKTKEWSNHAILFDVLPTLLRAALQMPSGAATPVFATSGKLQMGPALRAFLRDGANGDESPKLKVGHSLRTFEQVLAEITYRTNQIGQPPHDAATAEQVRVLLSRVEIEEGTEADTIKTRILTALRHVTGSARRAEAAYTALFTFIAEASQKPASTITAETFLAEAGLTPELLAPIIEFDRRAEDHTRAILDRRGYDEHKDVRGPVNLPDTTIALIEAESGSGKTWSLAASATAAVRAGDLAVWLDRPTGLADCQQQIVDQIWCQILRRSDATTFHTLLSDVADVLKRETVPRLLVLIDQLPTGADERADILQFNWAAAGMRLLAATSLDQADDAQAISAAPVLRLGNFSQVELRDLLERYHLSWSSIPSDARRWISRPVITGLYVNLAAERATWIDTSEYNLFDAFAERARRRGVASGIRGCRKFIADLGGQALAGAALSPLATQLPASDAMVAILIRTGWLVYDSDDNLIFAHDRLRDWAIAEHLSRSSQAASFLAPMLAGLAGYQTGTAAQPIKANYALMDTLWLISRAPDGSKRLGALLEVWDEDPKDWTVTHDLYRHLLATGGAQFLDSLMPSLLARLEGVDDARRSDAIVCIKGFAAARQASHAAIDRLLNSNSAAAQRAGCRLVAALPDPSRLGALAAIHRQATTPADATDLGDTALAKAAWSAIKACAAQAPAWAAGYFDREVGNDPGPAHLLSMLPDLPNGRAIWDKHGAALVDAYGSDLEARYWLAQAIGVFDDRRFDDNLAEWCIHPHGMAACPAWVAVCRWRPDLVRALAAKVPRGLFSINTDRWLEPLLEPGCEAALAAVVQAIKADDPSGCQLAFIFTTRAAALGDADLEWAAMRLTDALLPPERQDLVATRLLDLFAAIEDLDVVERLHTLVPNELPSRLIELAQRRIANGGLWHDPDLAAAETILRFLGRESSAMIVRMQLSQTNTILRWNAVRDAGFAPLDTVRTELEAIADPTHHEKEEGRLDAVRMIATRDPDWGHARVRDLLGAGTPSSINEAFWLAQRMPGDDFVPDAISHVPQVFSNAQTLYRVVDYLLSRKAGRSALSGELISALASQTTEESWILEKLGALNDLAADAALLARIPNLTNALTRAAYGFWGTLARPDQPGWTALADAAMSTHSTLALRHVRWFYLYAARQTGPAHDQLLSDAYPVNTTEYVRALNAINAIAGVDTALAADALGSLCRLFNADSDNLQKFAADLSFGTFQNGRAVIFANAIHWPSRALLTALTPKSQPYEASLVAAVEAGSSDSSEEVRRAACICRPFVSAAVPPQALFDDPSRSVRQAAEDAVKLDARRRRSLDLLDVLRIGDPERSRQAAAILVAAAERSKTSAGVPGFSRAEYLAAAPFESGLRPAYPRQ